MNDPLHYSESNHIQKRDAEELINHYRHLLKWTSNENILDIGCGDSSTTMEVLVPKLPTNFNKLLAVDVSQEMIEFARSECQNPKLQFSVFDISSPTLPFEYQQNFHHIFSFYCLNWVHDQRQAFENIFKMLKPGGQMMLCIAACGSAFPSWLKLAKSEKWAPYMTNVNDVVPIYYFSTDPKKDLENFLSQAGFIDYTCRVEDRFFVFSNFSNFMEHMCSLNVFIKNVPQSQRNDYIEDYTNCLKEDALFDFSSEKVRLKFEALTAFASKPM